MPITSTVTRGKPKANNVFVLDLGASAVIAHPGNPAAVQGHVKKLLASMRRRKLRPGIETASQGLKAMREGR